MTRRQLITARIVFVAYLVAVAFLCFGKFDGTQDVPLELWGIPTDKIVHFLMFFPFALLAYLAFERYKGKSWSPILCIALAFVAGCAFAAGTEWVQTRLPYRTGDSADFTADLLALGIASVIVLVTDLLKQKK